MLSFSLLETATQMEMVEIWVGWILALFHGFLWPELCQGNQECKIQCPPLWSLLQCIPKERKNILVFECNCKRTMNLTN